MRASLLVREAVHYRRAAFESGLMALGYQIHARLRDPRPEDVLAIWNRYGQGNDAAAWFDRAGAPVIVAENGLIGSDEQGRRLFTLSLDYHNGAGSWFVGSNERWKGQNITVEPWRKPGSKILVLPQRGIGCKAVAMPRDWANSVKARLRQITDRPIEIRQHPGNVSPPPDPDWTDVWAAVTWGSGAGIKAICAGVPVFHEMPNWIGATAAKYGIADIENPWRGDRTEMLQRLGWLQWSADEIATGEPFWRLLDLKRNAAA